MKQSTIDNIQDIGIIAVAVIAIIGLIIMFISIINIAYSIDKLLGELVVGIILIIVGVSIGEILLDE